MRKLDETNKYDMPEVIAKATVPPHSEVELILGIYEVTIPQPDFELVFHSDRSGSLSSHLERTMRDGEYMLTYVFENSSTVPVSIAVRERCV